jgi:N-formylglutamate amidohydrolase
MGAWPTRSPGAISRDAGTRPLAERVADVLGQRLGRRPALVIETYTRKHMDVNRAEAEAFERPEAQPAYRAYHAQVAAAVATLRARCPQGALLLDVHGQSDEPGTVFLGTRAGLTTRALLQRHGIDALHGPISVIGQLAARGHTVNPPAGSPSLKEDPRFAGGHTVFSYGSQQPEGIDAIQLEFGRSVRAQPGLAEDVAEALQGFMTHYGLLTR